MTQFDNRLEKECMRMLVLKGRIGVRKLMNTWKTTKLVMPKFHKSNEPVPFGGYGRSPGDSSTSNEDSLQIPSQAHPAATWEGPKRIRSPTIPPWTVPSSGALSLRLIHHMQLCAVDKMKCTLTNALLANRCSIGAGHLYGVLCPLSLESDKKVYHWSRMEQPDDDHGVSPSHQPKKLQPDDHSFDSSGEWIFSLASFWCWVSWRSDFFFIGWCSCCIMFLQFSLHSAD